jgi:hypothetical protein
MVMAHLANVVFADTHQQDYTESTQLPAPGSYRTAPQELTELERSVADMVSKSVFERVSEHRFVLEEAASTVSAGYVDSLCVPWSRADQAIRPGHDASHPCLDWAKYGICAEPGLIEWRATKRELHGRSRRCLFPYGAGGDLSEAASWLSVYHVLHEGTLCREP